MPKKSTWTYSKKRRKKKDKVFMDDTNIDEETVTETFMGRSRDSTSQAPSFPELQNLVKTEPDDSIEDQNCQAIPTTSLNAKSPAFTNISETRKMTDAREKLNVMTCDKLGGNKFMSMLQITTDEDEDKISLLSASSDIGNTALKKLSVCESSTKLKTSTLKTINKNREKRNCQSLDKDKQTVALRVSNDNQEPNDFRFSPVRIKQEPVDVLDDGYKHSQEYLKNDLILNSKAGSNKPPLSGESSATKKLELHKRTEAIPLVKKLSIGEDYASVNLKNSSGETSTSVKCQKLQNICIKSESVDTTEASQSKPSSPDIGCDSTKLLESQLIKKGNAFPGLIKLTNESISDPFKNKTNTQAEQVSSSLLKDMVPVSIKQEPMEPCTNAVPEKKLISDSPSANKSNHEDIQSISSTPCQISKAVNLQKKCENIIIADALFNSDVAKNIKKEVLDSISPNNLETPSSKQSGDLTNACKIKTTGNVCAKDNVSVQQMSGLKKCEISVNPIKPDIKKEPNESTEVRENQIQNNGTNLKKLNISQTQMPHNSKELIKSNVQTHVQPPVYDKTPSNDCNEKKKKHENVTNVDCLKLTSSKFIKQELISDYAVGIQKKISVNNLSPSFNSDQVPQPDLSTRVSTDQLVSEQKEVINETILSLRNEKSKIPLHTEDKLDAVCVVDVDTDKIISVIPSKNTESTDSIVITISDDENDFISIKENKNNASNENESKGITQVFSSKRSPVKSHETESLFNIKAELLTKGEVTSTSDAIQNTDIHTSNTNLNPDKFKKKSYMEAVNDHNLLPHEIQDRLFKSFSLSKNDENDIVVLDTFPVSEEEVSAYSNIMKEFHKIIQNSRKLVTDYKSVENDIFHLYKDDLLARKCFNNTPEDILKSSRTSPSVLRANSNQQSLSETRHPSTFSSDVFIKNEDVSMEMLHNIVMNSHSFVKPQALPDSTTNAISSIQQSSDVIVNDTEVLIVQDSHAPNQCTAEFDPAAKKLLNISSDELRNILNKTQNPFCPSPQPVSSSTENFISASERFPSSEVELHDKMENDPLKSSDKTPETTDFVHNSLKNLSSRNNTVELSSVETRNAEYKNFSDHITSSIVENTDGRAQKYSLENDNMISMCEQPVIKAAEIINKDLSINKKKDISFSDGNVSNEVSSHDYESDSTLPYEDMELSDVETSSDTQENKRDIEGTIVPKYTSKLEKIIEKRKSLIDLKEQHIQMKKSKILISSDPKLAKFCEKQREKKKHMIPVINPLPLESEKVNSKKIKSKQSSSKNCKETAKKSDHKKSAIKTATKDEKKDPRKKSLSSNVHVDDASNLFKPDCKIVQKPKQKHHGKKRPSENDAINAPVVSYGKRTFNRGTFLTETPSEEPPQKTRKKVYIPQSIPKPSITTESMHNMAESPQIEVFYPDNNLSHKSTLATQNVMGTAMSDKFGKTDKPKVYGPNKINLEEYNKRQKNLSSSNRDVYLNFSKKDTQPSVSLLSGNVDRDSWSPASSNSSFTGFEKQINPFERISQPNTNINQNFSMGNYFPSSTSDPLNFTHYNTESSQQESLNFPRHQFPLLPPPNIPPYFVSPVEQLNSSNPEFEAQMSGTSLVGDRSISSSFLTNMPAKAPHPLGTVQPKSKRCSSLVPKTLKARIGHKFIKTEHMTLLVLEWSVDWLIQQQKNQSPPPITSACSPLKQVVNYYKTFDDHYNTYFPLLLLELWQRLYHAWTHITNYVLFCDIDSFNSVIEFSNVELVTFVRDSDVEEKKYPEEGTVVILRFVSSNGSGIKMLGYIKNVSINNNNWNSDPKYERYGSNSNEHSLMLRLSVMCAYNSADINLNEKVRIQVLYNIKAYLKQNDALVNARESNLGEIILKPDGESVISVALGTRQTHQDVTISQTVRNIVDGVSLPYLMPQLTVVKALPSSDRITTIVCLIEEIKNLQQHKVLLCTRTKNAFKDIGFNLEDSQLDMVILGSKLEVHRKLRKHMLDERASMIIKEHSSSNHTKATKETVFRAKKVIIEKCDVILAPIQNCYNDVVADAVNEDFQMSLTCIIDEANLCTEPESLIPLLYGTSKLILIGDPNDPAKVCSRTANNNNYNRSFFERAYNLNVDCSS